MTSSGRSSSWTLLLVLAFVLGFLFPGSATATGGSGNGSGVDRGGDDETIGTLPIVGNHGQQLALVRRVRDTRPDFYLEGSYGELLSTIVGFTGSGCVTYENRPGGTVRLGFHGQLELALDRNLLQVTGIQIGAFVPAAYSGARAWSGFAGLVAPTRALRPGDLALPVAALDGLGALDRTPWILAARSRVRGSYEFHALADAGVLYIGQTY
jgi:hypothetical protein